jgi:hypothetical protein
MWSVELAPQLICGIRFVIRWTGIKIWVIKQDVAQWKYQCSGWWSCIKLNRWHDSKQDLCAFVWLSLQRPWDAGPSGPDDPQLTSKQQTSIGRSDGTLWRSVYLSLLNQNDAESWRGVGVCKLAARWESSTRSDRLTSTEKQVFVCKGGPNPFLS